MTGPLPCSRLMCKRIPTGGWRCKSGAMFKRRLPATTAPSPWTPTPPTRTTTGATPCTSSKRWTPPWPATTKRFAPRRTTLRRSGTSRSPCCWAATSNKACRCTNGAGTPATKAKTPVSPALPKPRGWGKRPWRAKPCFCTPNKAWATACNSAATRRSWPPWAPPSCLKCRRHCSG